MTTEYPDDTKQSQIPQRAPGGTAKRVLIVYYSQSGDVHRALEALVRPLEMRDVEITWRRIDSAPAYPFPWRAREFFDCMPEAVSGEPPALAQLDLDATERFDLILIGWQVWFLSPSLPIQAFFATRHAEVMRGTRVITVTCCRQMWQRAQAKMRALIAAAGGIHTDSIVVTHQGSALLTYITAPRIMLTGRRDKIAFLPAGGVARTEIDKLGRFGSRLLEAADRWAEATPTPLLTGLRTATVNVASLLPELIGVGCMMVFARLARLCGGPGNLIRLPVIWLFVLLLMLLLPIVLTISAVLTPVLKRVLTRRLARYAQVV
ncbi:hypothetical protein GCM10009789_77510 [Kribbella sancticallisti]|uniref:Dialkylrecorsinol condensing enzyme n=1 Tax=Kribbella sancticallisti TaxID=460087 RepID=A0ABN2EM82_9ACTN